MSLDPVHLPFYALRTTLRMLLAIVCSTVFTFIYAAVAAKSRRAEMVLVPLLDILQSVPILGFLTFTVVFPQLPGRDRAEGNKMTSASILIVEDEALIRMMTAEMVEELGHRVVAQTCNVSEG